MKQYTRFNENATYKGIGHDDTVGQPGHGNAVRFDDGDTGRVISSNRERSLVEYQTTNNTVRDWFPNTMLSISIEHIVS